MSTNLRPIRPRGYADDRPIPEYPLSPINKGPKGRIACGSCRKLRQKCDGQRPACSRCQTTKHDCVYEVDYGETRMQGIRRANRQLIDQVDTFKSLFRLLKSATDDTKAQILARLAADDPPELILRNLKEGRDAGRKWSNATSSDESRTEESPQSSHKSSVDVKIEPDDDVPLPPGIVPWHIEKMHYLLQRVGRIDLNSGSLGSQENANNLLMVEDEDRKSTEFIQSVILADRRAHSDYLLPPGAVEGFGNLPLSSAIRANHYPPAVQARQLLNMKTEEYRLPSFMASDGSPLSNIFYSYRDAAMEMLSNGVPSYQVLGPSDHVDIELFFREREAHDAYDIHSWACELVKNIDGYDTFVKLASAALYTTYMRWTILPTATNYARMPEMIRPTKQQRLMPHRMTIDLVPHPAIRNALIDRFRDWLSPGTTDTGGTSVGWPYSLDAAVDVCPLTGRRMLSRAFYEHATNGLNWSLDKSIRAIFPEIEAMGFKIRD
ncbi:bZIP transcription factor [Colletotrichum truncatum]|uniref:BZIP transcription factor n=1 Tax=Colletotrichum truncatum TaxID=5467 RepID=A0ACC3YM02_COLTU|nr:bZIP transcription factor [Colletotrichum truncatum]KAF6791544.1 bZIP transcription factor [Colletotrichum truncatum]